MLVTGKIVRFTISDVVKRQKCNALLSKNIYPCSIVLHKSIFTSHKLNASSLMERYESYLKSRLPKVYEKHRLMMDGCKWCISDLKTYYRIRKDLLNNKITLADLNVDELKIFIQAGSEVAKLLMIIAISPLPLAMPAILLSIIFFPRIILTRHFWTKDQRREFWSQSIATNVHTLYPFLLKLISNIPKDNLNWSTISQIKVPSLSQLPFLHVAALCRVHRSFLLAGTIALENHALGLKHLDDAMYKKILLNPNFINDLDNDELYMHLFLRSIPFQDKSIDEMRDVLQQWIINSSYLSKNLSLYLHLPLVLPQLHIK